MPAIFDLTASPFAILGVSLRTRQSDIAAAYEDALSDHRHSEAALAKAQQALLVPKSRLEAELAWLPATAPTTAKTVLELLGDADGIYDAVCDLLKEMTGLDHANLAADLCCRDKSGSGHALELIEGYRDITPKTVLAILSENRNVSGFAKIDPVMLETGLESLRRIHAKAAMEFIKAEPHPGVAMLELVNNYLEDEDGQIELIMFDLAREYDAWSESKLRDIRDKIHKEIEDLKIAPDMEPGYDLIKAYLEEWDEYSQPMQVIEQAKGHDEPRSKDLYNEIRDFCLWLANEQGDYEHALRVSKDVQQIFPELPSVSLTVQEDVETLERLAGESKQNKLIEPLIDVLGDIIGEETNLIHDVIMSGFGATSQGLSGSLYKAFTQTVELTRGTDHSDAPWNIIRNIALKLNNDHEAPGAAYLLLDGVVKYSKHKPSPEMAAVLRREHRVSRVNELTDDLKRAPDPDARLKILDMIIPLAEGDDKKTFIMVRQAIVSVRTKSRVRWGIAAVVVGGIIWAIIAANDKPRYKPSYTASTPSYDPTPTYTPPSTPTYTPPSSTTTSTANNDWVDVPTALDWRKSAPPGTLNAILSRDQLRYCMFEGEVLDSARLMIDNNIENDVDKFNAAVGEYNRRCSDFRYYEDDMAVVKGEITRSRNEIHKAATLEVMNWRHGEPEAVSNPNPLEQPLNDVNTMLGAIIVQNRLQALGFYNGIIDGDWGSGSKRALRAWKKSVGLPESDTWTRSIEALLMGK